MTRAFLRLAVGLATLTPGVACAPGPAYTRPVVEIPTTFRAAPGERSEVASFGDAKWWEVFEDAALQSLVREALAQNYDLRIAVSRVLQAQAQLGITRSEQFPTVSANVSHTAQRGAESVLSPAYHFDATALDVGASWEVDVWQRLRQATDAARATLLATVWGQRAVVSTLVSDVATSYFQLRELDLELEIARRTLSSRQESLALIQLQTDRGAASLLDVRQAEQLVYTASSQIPDLERRIEQQENRISVLIGRSPGAIPRGRTLPEQPLLPEIPAGVPSSLLARRPDVIEAEQQLMAQHAQVLVARAAYLPQITLTADGGTQSAALRDLFSGPAGLWSFVANLAQPIFTAGRIRSGVQLAESQQQEAVLRYQQTIQAAFRDVSDALVAYRRYRELREQQALLTAAAQDAARLSSVRYAGGAASYLEVLTNETNYFAAELDLTQTELNVLIALVQVYAALGGGWETP